MSNKDLSKFGLEKDFSSLGQISSVRETTPADVSEFIQPRIEGWQSTEAALEKEIQRLQAKIQHLNDDLTRLNIHRNDVIQARYDLMATQELVNKIDALNPTPK